MAFNGSGVFSLVAGNPVVTGTVISSTWANNTLSDIANNGLTNCLTKDGQQTPTNNIPMGNFRITNLADAVNLQDAVTAKQVQNGGLVTLAAVSGTDTITATTSPGITGYVAGQRFQFVAAGANTTSTVTLNINSLGAKAVTQLGASSMQPGSIQSGAIVTVVYDGTQFQALGINTGASIVGIARSPRVIQAAASQTMNFTADEVVVETAFGGVRYCIANINLNVNMATTGAGGMDTGAAPANSGVCIYLIYNPTTGTSALLARNGPTLQSNIYAGANMPAGYTASALVAVWTTNGSAQFVPGYMRDRTVVMNESVVLSSTTVQGSLQTLALANNVAPANAIAVYGNVNCSPVTAGTLALINLFSTLQGGGPVKFAVAGVNNLGQGGPYRLPMATTQSIYYTSALSGGTFQYSISVCGYDF